MAWCVKQQAITWINDNQILSFHIMVSLGHNELKGALLTLNVESFTPIIILYGFI